ncbi:MAG: glycosyl hydrolase, partial [Opitutales bacterium]
LLAKLRPDVAYSQSEPDLGFVHRHTDAGEVYFLVNTTDHPISDTAVIRVDGLQPEWWNPVTGAITPATVSQRYSGATAVPVSLAPYDAQFLVFTNRTLPAAPTGASSQIADLSQGSWDVTFKNASAEPDPAPAQFDTLHSWTDIPALQYFSGVATYTKQFTLTPDQLAGSAPICVDFGPGQPSQVAGGAQGMRANFQPPVADAAIVYINGQRAGALWCPPYSVDVTKLLKPGSNEIRIEVANRATNYMADFDRHPLPDYTELNANRTYGGNRFAAQDMNRIVVLPSGLLGPVHLVAGSVPN